MHICQHIIIDFLLAIFRDAAELQSIQKQARHVELISLLAITKWSNVLLFITLSTTYIGFN